jgi:hypothetical protein
VEEETEEAEAMVSVLVILAPRRRDDSILLNADLLEEMAKGLEAVDSVDGREEEKMDDGGSTENKNLIKYISSDIFMITVCTKARATITAD